MLIRLFLLFTLVPMLELFLLVQLGSFIGPWWTMAIVLTTGFAGAWLARREGVAVLRQLQEELTKGLPPGDKLMEAGLVVAGGLLLVTPGIGTDITGFLLIVPFTRRWIAPRVLRWLLARFGIDVALGGHRVDPGEPFVSRPGARPGPEEPDSPSHFDHPVR